MSPSRLALSALGLLVLLLSAPPAVAADRITVALLPQGTTVEQLGAVQRISPGILSAGLGEVDAAQTYLDISQGNRVSESLYDSDLPPLELRGADRVPGWQRIVARADDVPADIVPGLLAGTLAQGLGRSPAVAAAPGLGNGSLLAADRGGRIGRIAPGCRRRACMPPVAVRDARLGQLPALVTGLRGGDLLIALERPPPLSGNLLAIGIAGRGFGGNLTSDSTRTDGFVVATDIAPTILNRLGVRTPPQMTGQTIRAEGEADPQAVASLEDRLGVIGHRRGVVLGLTLLVWLGVFGAALALRGSRVARPALRLLTLSLVYLPLALLPTAALRPDTLVELLIVAIGAPLLAAATLRVLGGYRALAAACALTVAAYAIDMAAGSSLTSLSLLGPNPSIGARFYGIGNELEATLATLGIAGAGAAIAGFWPRLGPHSSAIAFLVTGVVLALVFAAGRLGADVGAALVLPAGAAVAAIVIAPGRRRALLILAAPLLALAGIALVDLLSGGNSHFSHSVLDAGGLHDLGNLAERRLRLSALSFGRTLVVVFIPVVAIEVWLAVRNRDRLRTWVRDAPAVRAGLFGAAAAALAGTLANDSGGLFLVVASLFIPAFLGFAWSLQTR